jgi:Protein of unknown function VcgC/VcgE (DUF2780)/TAT (twin-arginine translocation) pathway signal sequence
MQTRRQFLAMAAVGAAAALFAGCASTSSYSGDALMGSLTGSGLSTSQAAGGLGSVLALAQSKLPAAEYSSLTKYLPGADKYVKVAQDAGVLSDPIRDVQQMNDAFKKLGLDAGQARSLLGSTSDYLAKQGGESARGLLARTLN